MSLRSRIFLLFSLSTLAILSACGGGGSKPVIPAPPPTGGFSNTNLNGTYTFSVSGANGNGLFAMAGSFVACGCSQGNITSGTIDIVDPTGPQPLLQLLPASNFSISPDGRGTAALVFNTATISNYEIDLAFVLTSSSHGLVTRHDQNGTGSGTIDLQDPTVSQSQLAGQFYAFSLSGGDFSTSPLSLASVGDFQLDSTGTITSNTGFADFNLGANLSSQTGMSGTLVLGSGTVPGLATLSAPTFSATSLQFDVYAVDSTHLKLIEIDNQFIQVGDALIQPTNAFPSGNLVFTMAGPDPNGSMMAMGGFMAVDTSTGTITNGVEDVNDNGVIDGGTSPVTAYSFTGTMVEPVTGSGRWIVTLTNFVGGNSFIAYPYQGGLVLLQSDAGGVTGGSALEQQTGATDLASQGYGLNISGADLNVVPATEADEIAEFKANGGNLTGTVDINDGGSLATQALTGTYGAASLGGFTGAGTATLTAGFGGMFYYVVDSGTALFISTDSTLPALGSMSAQSTPSSKAAISTQAHRLIPMPHLVPHKKSAMNPHRAATLDSKPVTISRR